jgi:hypothetical protein
MVLAIGSQFADVGTPDANADTNPSSDSISSGVPSVPLDFPQLTIPSPIQNPGWRFYELSRRFLPDIICSSSMTSIQVCILQGIFLPSTKSRDAGYNMLGIALRMAINIGMHRSFNATTTSPRLHPHVRELRNRLWWSVYVAERLYSIEMGRPLSFSDSEIDAPFPVVVPEWCSPSRGTGNSMDVDGLIAMAKLCQLMGKIVEAVYCKPPLSAGKEKSAIIQPRIYRQLKCELEQYKRDLPPQLKFSRSESANMTRSVAHLALTYEQATMLLTRSCLNLSTTIITTTATTTAAAPAAPAEADEATKAFVRAQAQSCLTSALASIHILENLKSRSLLCQFSFHDSLYCIAALYVLLLVGKKPVGLTGCPSSSITTHNESTLASDSSSASASTSMPPSNKLDLRIPITQGVRILLALAKGSEAAASGLRYIIHAMQVREQEQPDHGGKPRIWYSNRPLKRYGAYRGESKGMESVDERKWGHALLSRPNPAPAPAVSRRLLRTWPWTVSTGKPSMARVVCC